MHTLPWYSDSTSAETGHPDSGRATSPRRVYLWRNETKAWVAAGWEHAQESRSGGLTPCFHPRSRLDNVRRPMDENLHAA